MSFCPIRRLQNSPTARLAVKAGLARAVLRFCIGRMQDGYAYIRLREGRTLFNTVSADSHAKV